VEHGRAERAHLAIAAYLRARADVLAEVVPTHGPHSDRKPWKKPRSGALARRPRLPGLSAHGTRLDGGFPVFTKAVFILSLAVLTACAADAGNSDPGNGKSTCGAGDAGCACYPNATCNAGLQCRSSICSAAPQPQIFSCPGAHALCEGPEYLCKTCCPSGSYAFGGGCIASRDLCDLQEKMYGTPCLARACNFSNSCYK